MNNSTNILDYIYGVFYEYRHNVEVICNEDFSVADKIYEKINPNPNANDKKLVLVVDLADEDSFESTWIHIIEELYEQVITKGMYIPGIGKEYRCFEETRSMIDYDFIEIHAGDFLEDLYKLDVEVFLIIDNFDLAKEKFRGERHYYEFMRTAANGFRSSLTLMLITQQGVKNIEADPYSQSTLFGIMEPITIKEL